MDDQLDDGQLVGRFSPRQRNARAGGGYDRQKWWIRHLENADRVHDRIPAVHVLHRTGVVALKTSVNICKNENGIK